MIEGLKIMKKVDDTIKQVKGGDSKKKGEPKKQKKARPTCKIDEEEEKR